MFGTLNSAFNLLITLDAEYNAQLQRSGRDGITTIRRAFVDEVTILLAEHQQLQAHLGQLLKRCHLSLTPHERALQEHLDKAEGINPEQKARRNLLPAFQKSGWRTILEIEESQQSITVPGTEIFRGFTSRGGKIPKMPRKVLLPQLLSFIDELWFDKMTQDLRLEGFTIHLEFQSFVTAFLFSIM